VKQLFLCLTVAAGVGQAANIPDVKVPVAPVTLYSDFQQAMPEAVMDALHREADSLMAPAGMSFEWQALKEFRSEKVSVAVAVVHFEGRCDVEGLALKEGQTGSLGWTEITDGRILPFMHVDCGRVRTFLQSTLLGYKPADRERAFGRALGRVLAHELYHVFSVTPKHAARGVAKEEYTVENLLSGGFQFQEKDARALRASRILAALKAAPARP